MSDPDKEDSGQQPKTDDELQREKTELEIKKLRIDLKKYQDRVDLEQQKLVSELRDWYYRLVTAVLSTAVAVGTFFLGQHFQKKSDEDKQRLEEAKQSDARFKDYLATLASTDVAVRSSAAIPLQQYILDAERYSPKDSTYEAQSAREHSAVAISELAARLTADSEPSALEEYATALEKAAPVTAEAIADANREAAMRFASEAAAYVSARLHESPDDNEVICEDYEAQDDYLADLQLMVLRERMPFEGHASTINEVGYINPRFDVRMLLRSYPLKQRYQRQCKVLLQARTQAHAAVEKSAPATASSSPDQFPIPSARNLVASSVALAGVARSGKVNGVSLQGIFLVAGVSGDVELAGLDVRDSYIAGLPESFKCKDCNLSNADLRGLTLPTEIGKLDFTGSLTNETHFRGPVPNTVIGDHEKLKKALQYCSDKPDAYKKDAYPVHVFETLNCKAE